MQKYKESLIALPLIGRRYIFPWIIKREGGQQQSITLREWTLKKYKVNVGMHSYGSCFDTYFNTGGSIEIGRYCSFGPNIRYFGANHPMHYATMSPYFYQQKWAGGVQPSRILKEIILK